MSQYRLLTPIELCVLNSQRCMLTVELNRRPTNLLVSERERLSRLLDETVRILDRNDELVAMGPEKLSELQVDELLKASGGS